MFIVSMSLPKREQAFGYGWPRLARCRVKRLVAITLFFVSHPAERSTIGHAHGHGFAGSRQMMQGYAFSLAQAGYRVLAFDFEGHGRHPVPMSGDVTSINGTTQLLVEQTLAVVNEADNAAPVALLGHSMATDILIRAAIVAPDRIGPLVVVSAFSQAVNASEPVNMLMITGAWEAGLRDFARRSVAMVDPNAVEGELAQSGDVVRKAVVAPLAEHVGVLHSRLGRAEAVDWLNMAYGRGQTAPVLPTGPATLILLIALVGLARPLARLLPSTPDQPRTALSRPRFAALLLVPTLVAPVLAVLVDLHALPVLVADHLAVHLGLFGLIQLTLLRAFGISFGRVAWLGTVTILIWGLLIFGLGLDRYAANFWPIPERMLIITALALGAVRAVAFFRLVAVFVVFFLIMIAPVIVLFYALFGLVGRWVARRQGAMAAGLGLGLCLAWSLGVSFPMFAIG